MYSQNNASKTFFLRDRAMAVSPRPTFLSWQTSLLCIVVKLAGVGSAIYGPTPASFLVWFALFYVDVKSLFTENLQGRGLSKQAHQIFSML